MCCAKSITLESPKRSIYLPPRPSTWYTTNAMAEGEKTPQAADHGDVLLEWKFPEVPTYRRGRRWYFAMAAFGVATIAWSIYDRNPMFAIIILLFLAIVFFQSRQTAKTLTARVREDGIEIGRNFYDYDDVRNFWIIYRPPAKALYMRFKSAFRPILGISLEDVDPAKLRKVLVKYLSEDLDQEEEPASDAYGRLFKL